jgi:5-hydroxyisourate hydrolase
MSQLTTHVLDIVRGTGAGGMHVEVSAPDGRVSVATLDDGGRATLMTSLVPGAYEIRFFAGDYLGAKSFYDIIPVRCLIDAEIEHYHVPLILSAYGYSTYRGG